MADHMPVELRVWSLLRDRVPAHRWDPKRTFMCVSDFMRDIDCEEVAARCADWMVSGSATKVRDPVSALRTFMEKERRVRRAEQKLAAPADPTLAIYHRPLNAVS